MLNQSPPFLAQRCPTDSDARTLYVDGFWSHGHGNEGAIRVGEHEGA